MLCSQPPRTHRVGLMMNLRLGLASLVAHSPAPFSASVISFTEIRLADRDRAIALAVAIGFRCGISEGMGRPP